MTTIEDETFGEYLTLPGEDRLMYALRQCREALDAAKAGDLEQTRVHLRVAIPSLQLEAEVPA